jgi:uncharacterized repeat protein (TIGR02543 family)
VTYYRNTTATDGATYTVTENLDAGDPISYITPAWTNGTKVFSGWSLNRADTCPVTDPPPANYDGTTATQDITVYAVWCPPKFTVTFDAYGGTPTPAQQTVTDGSPATEPAPAPTNGTCTFLGWYTDAAHTTQWNFADPVTGNMTLYANWDCKQTITITYHRNTSPTDSAIYIQTIPLDAGDTVPYITPAWTNGNKTFGGWSLNANDTCPVTGPPPATYDPANTFFPNGQLYAVWCPPKYTVTFDANGGTPTPAPQTVTDGTPATEPAPAPTNGSCCTLLGWFTDPAHTIKWDFSSPVTQNMTLYAGWDCQNNPVQHTVTFDAMGGTPPPATQTVADGALLQSPQTTTLGNCALQGWYTDPGLTTPWNFAAPVTRDMTLYARWNCVQTITFNTGGGTNVPTLTQVEGERIAAPADPTKSGCTFAGWYQDPYYNEPWNFSMSVKYNMTLYAKWDCATTSAPGYSRVISSTGTGGYRTWYGSNWTGYSNGSSSRSSSSSQSWSGYGTGNYNRNVNININRNRNSC